MGIEPTTSYLRCDALPIELPSPLGAGGGEEGIQVLVLGAHYIKYSSLTEHYSSRILARLKLIVAMATIQINTIS